MTSGAAHKARGGRREKSTSRQVNKSKAKAGAKHREAAKPPVRGLEVAELEVLIEELRVIENTITTLPGLVEHARAIANAFECDEPDRRDAIARLGMRFPSAFSGGGGGRDIDRFGPSDMRMPDDDLLEGMVDAASAVVEAATWRIQRLARVLFRVAESQPPEVVNKSTSQQ